uniref:Uncharacterized protein n=1 Tax=Trypanosoma congolense (strain IL3000) TaxID=1068625 RepID=G0UZI7_TRYCI|nr:conserved hypothetical protein [Trypanosoma congolense IL3000]
MRDDICLVLASLTCFYWALSHLVLLARALLPRFGAVVRYGRRSVVATTATDRVASSKQPLGGGDVGSGGNLWVGTTCRWFVRRLIVPLESCFLCRVKVSRKNSFCAFYVTGVVVTVFILEGANGFQCVHNEAAEGACPPRVSSFTSRNTRPLVAFLVHCIIRLLECLFLHRFSGGQSDYVTCFAAVAGCTFYVFASYSSGAVVLCGSQFKQGPDEYNGPDVALRPFAVTCAVDVLFFVHIALQVTQVYHHQILAMLRKGHASCRDSHKGRVRGTVTLYRFPRAGLFRFVQEPHYTCEIAMYAINLVSVWLLTCPEGSLFPSLMGTSSEIDGSSSMAQRLLQMGCLAALGVLSFSLINLGITACEHRRFWKRVNEERDKRDQEPVPKWNLIYGVW